MTVNIDQSHPLYESGMSAQIKLNAVNNIMAGRSTSGIPFGQLTLEQRFQRSFEEHVGFMVRHGRNVPGGTRDNLRNVADLFSGVTGNAIAGARRDSYWHNPDGTPTFMQNSEFFANHFASYIHNDTRAMGHTANFLPTAYAELNNFIDHALDSMRGHQAGGR